MDEHKRGLAPLTEGIWPPAPLRGELPPLFLRLEGMQITQSRDRLVILNMSIRRLFLVEVCILSASLFSPMISFWTSPFHHATLPGLLPYMVSAYRLSHVSYLMLLVLMGIFWCLFTYFGNLWGVTFDKYDRSVKAGGRGACPMSSIEAVFIKPIPNTLLGRQYTVNLQWGDDDPTPRWQKTLTTALGNRCPLGALRQEAHAEEVAALIAGFIGVPVHRETMLGTRPAPTHLGTRP